MSILLVFFFVCISAVYAEGEEIRITALEPSYEKDGAHIEVQVELPDKNFVTTGKYFSYHIFNQENMVRFENERYPLEELKTETIIVIDPENIPEIKGLDKISVQFDIVDEENVYWYSMNEDKNLISDEVEVDLEQSRSIIAEYKKYAVIVNKIQFAISVMLNLAGWAILGLIIYIVKKKF